MVPGRGVLVVVYTFIVAISGIVAIDVRVLCVSVYKIQRANTAPKALLLMSVYLMFIQLVLMMQVGDEWFHLCNDPPCTHYRSSLSHRSTSHTARRHMRASRATSSQHRSIALCCSQSSQASWASCSSCRSTSLRATGVHSVLPHTCATLCAPVAAVTSGSLRRQCVPKTFGDKLPSCARVPPVHALQWV